MLIANWTSQFKKDLKRLNKRGNDLEELKKVMKMIEEEVELPEEIYRAHKLRPTKDYNDCWSAILAGTIAIGC